VVSVSGPENSVDLADAAAAGVWLDQATAT
jgi:hypothetical protein